MAADPGGRTDVEAGRDAERARLLFQRAAAAAPAWERLAPRVGGGVAHLGQVGRGGRAGLGRLLGRAARAGPAGLKGKEGRAAGLGLLPGCAWAGLRDGRGVAVAGWASFYLPFPLLFLFQFYFPSLIWLRVQIYGAHIYSLDSRI